MSSDFTPDRSARPVRSSRSRWILWLAQGFGSGQAPAGPGTFGSAVGMGWLLLLVWPENLVVFCAGAVAGVALSVWACGKAEKILGQSDPGSVVLDEIAAVPLCFVAWMFLHANDGAMPGASDFFSARAWMWTAGIFVLFRIFDIAKPWPVGATQKLPGGWGVTADDVAAAVYVNAVVVLAWLIRG
jgi:phosphatidylglycerophosphatase A